MTSTGTRRLLNSTERAEYGVTLTIRERTTGEERLIVVEGLGVMAALREAIKEIDALEGSWYVQTLSSPETIYTDLTIARRLSGKPLLTPEASMLGRAGRLDLLRERPPWARSDGRRKTAAGGT